MVLRKSIGTGAAALVLVGMLSGVAAAQTTPTLSATVVGNAVNLQWTAVSGASDYEFFGGTTPGGTNVGTVSLPSALGLSARLAGVPNGTYYIRVRGALGAQRGPFSNEVIVTVGGAVPGPPPGPCTPGAAPALQSAVDGGSVNLTWTAVPGAVGYAVQYSRTPGGTDLTETTAATAVQKFIGQSGTFYARVVAVTACGNAVSNERAFTISAIPPTPLSPAQILSILQQTAAAYPRSFQHAHVAGDPERYDFIILAGKRLFQASGGLIGLNWRRAAVGDLSMDGLTVTGSDGRFYFADVIFGAGGPNPVLHYETPGPNELLRDPSGRYAPHGFANPIPLRTVFNYGVQ